MLIQTAMMQLAGPAGSTTSGIDMVLILLMSSGFTGIIVTLIGFFVNRKKNKAEEAGIVSHAAVAVLERLESENVRLSGERDAARSRIADLELALGKYEDRMDSAREQIRAHLNYDRELIRKLTDAGIEFDAPPRITIGR